MPTPIPPGVVAIISGDLVRYANAQESILGLCIGGGVNFTPVWAKSTGVAVNLNNAIKAMRELDAAWVWIMGDDHEFPPDILLRLLTRFYEHDLDVLAPLCPNRVPPILPVIYRKPAENVRPGYWDQYTWDELPPEGGLMEVEACGNAGMLVHRRVIEALGGPYWFQLGRHVPENPSEDLSFCDDVRAAGFKVHVDLDVLLGHMSPVTYWPKHRADGTWGCEVDLGNNAVIGLNFKVTRKTAERPERPA